MKLFSVIVRLWFLCIFAMNLFGLDTVCELAWANFAYLTVLL